MQDVPKIVRERLKVATPAVNHPDADVLTAFSEQSLPDLERDIVLEHLARCGECREVVALALPDTEAVQTVLRPAPGRWLAWPALRWGFVSAGIILVASLAVVLYQRQTRPATMAYQAAAPSVMSSEPEGKSVPASVPAEAATTREPAQPLVHSVSNGMAEDKKVQGKEIASPTASVMQMQANEPVAAPAAQIGGVIAGDGIRRQLAHGPRLANQQQQNAFAFQNQAQNTAPAASPTYAKQLPAGEANARDSASQSVQVSVQAGPVDSPAQDTLALKGEAIPLQPSSGGTGGVVVNRAKDPGTLLVGSVEVPGGSMSSPYQGSAIGGPMPASSARWNINSTGALQRSIDQGNTWQDVNVNAPPAPATGASFDVTAKATAKKKDASPLLNRDAIAPTFRSVAANGADVWAGGSGGMLYHSVDSGATWTRVIPSSSGATLTGDVVSLESPDMLHLKISTSTPEIWITTDAGLTWLKQ